MVLLAAVLPNPKSMKPNYVNKNIYWRSKIILARLNKYEFITTDEYNITRDQLDKLYYESRKYY